MISISARSCAASSGRLPSSKALAEFLALLHHLGEDLQHIVVAGRVLADAAIGDVAVLDRRLDHAQRQQTRLVSALSAVFNASAMVSRMTGLSVIGAEDSRRLAEAQFAR